MKQAVLILSLILLVGCGGEVTLDTTSKETFEKTLDQMFNKVSAGKRTELEKSVALIPMGDAIKDMTEGKVPEAKPQTEVFKSFSVLHGKNADEIIAHSKQVEAKIKENPMGKMMIEAAMKALEMKKQSMQK